MKYLYQNNYWSINKEYLIDKILYLMIDRPDEITSCNYFIWSNKKNQSHRNYDLPSEIDFNIDDNTCSFSWFINNKLHRNNKPAYISWDGCKRYYINDFFIKEKY